MKTNVAQRIEKLFTRLETLHKKPQTLQENEDKTVQPSKANAAILEIYHNFCQDTTIKDRYDSQTHMLTTPKKPKNRTPISKIAKETKKKTPQRIQNAKNDVSNAHDNIEFLVAPFDYKEMETTIKQTKAKN